jgi:hypothetical protein
MKDMQIIETEEHITVKLGELRVHVIVRYADKNISGNNPGYNEPLITILPANGNNSFIFQQSKIATAKEVVELMQVAVGIAEKKLADWKENKHEQVQG